MAYDRKIYINPWTEKHEEFCFENKIPPAAQKLWQWLLRQGESGSEIEPDLTEFNTWIAKSRGKGYSHEYLKSMLNLLVECRVVNILKDFCWKIKRILVRPLTWLNPLKKKAKKNLQNPDESLETHPSNASNFDTGDNSSSNYSNSEEVYLEQEHQRQQEILNTCAEHGIYFNPEKQPEVLAHDIEDVQSAINHFHQRGGHELNNKGNKKIPNPQGWLVRCLQQRWWEDSKFGVEEFINSMIEFVTRKPK
jgi:hypothetical protein